MPEKNVEDHAKRTVIMSAEDWLSMELSADEKDVIIGTPENPLIRPKTRNIIEAPEKSFKTTFSTRLTMGISCGETVYPALPVRQAGKVLYLHGELGNEEIKERTQAATEGLTGPFTEFMQGKSLDAHLVTPVGQETIRQLLRDYQPDHLVLDAWQSFISGCDENSFKEISVATHFCDEIIEEFGITLWIAIHQGKNPERGARGHSCIAGWRDTRIALCKDGNTVRVRVQPRWASSPPRFDLRFDDGILVPENGPITYSKQTASIRHFVEQSGGKAPKADVIDYLHLTKDAGRKAMARAVEAGAVTSSDEFLEIPLTPEVDLEQKVN